MPAKKKQFSDIDIALKGLDYFNKKNAIKELESYCKQCRKPLEDYINSSGITTANGSRLAVVSHADVDVHLKQTLRVSKQLLPEAIDVLKENGLDECVEQIQVVREDIVESLYESGKIDSELLKKIYVPKESYAFSVEVKDRMKDAPE